MKNITTFNNFLNNKILEKMTDLKVNELELILSDKLKKILREIEPNHQIAKDLLALHRNSEPVYKKTFLDLGSDSDSISFISSNKVPELLDQEPAHGIYVRKFDAENQWIGGEFEHELVRKNPWVSSDVYMIPDLHAQEYTSKDHPVWLKYRGEMNIGRFIAQTFPNKYPSNRKRTELAEMKIFDDIESFTNMYKAMVDSHAKKIEIVSGEDILKYYNVKNYFKVQGTLGNSCMRDPEKNHFMELYSKNSDKISMLVLYPEDVRDKIIGRAILWKLDVPKNRYFMDRIYTAFDSDEFMFIEYAKKNGWLFKTSQQQGANIKIEDSKNGNTSIISMSVKLNNTSFKKFPYMDTLQYYNIENNILTNNIDKIPSKGRIILTSTSGNYN